MSEAVLVLGGAGYIGSHALKVLSSAGHDVLVVDDLSNGHRDAARFGDLSVASIADSATLVNLCQEHGIKQVLHFAAFMEVGESVRDPAKYYENNVINSKRLLDALVEAGVTSIVFSSTAAVYGNPIQDCITEDHPKAPINPYGRTKLAVEWMLQDYAQAYGIKTAALRYFNAAGADPDGELGERHDPETHLLPLVLQAASGRCKDIAIFGDDYDTRDGTCVRDFIHVTDLADAHLRALDYLASQPAGTSEVFNLGNGNGFTVREVIETAEHVVGHEIPKRVEARRAGDPAVLVADSTKAREVLGWKPKYADLETIVRHAWEWERKRSD